MTDTVEAAAPDGLAGWTVDLMETFGGPGAGFAIFAENLFPPLPSEVVLPMAGFAASLGDLTLIEAIIWTTVGSVTGAWALYAVGAWLGHDRMRRLATRIPLVDVEDVDRATTWFDRHGKGTVFFGRMIPVFRSFVSIPAGIERMNFAAFTFLTTMGSLIWNTVFVLAGYSLGENWHVIDPYTSALQYVVVGIVLSGIAWFVYSRVKRSRRNAETNI